jgi:DNA polymerase III subunit delta
MKSNLGEISRALDAPPDHIRLFLIYGPDEAGARALTKRLERAMGAGAERIDLDNATLKTDPARLADEAASISLFGDKRWIRIAPAGDECLTAIQALLEAATAGNPVIALSSATKPTAALVKATIDHPAAMVHAVYVPDEKQAIPLAIGIARELGIRLPPESARAIAQACGNDRAIMAQELEKIALYLDAAPDRPKEAGTDVIDTIGAESNEGELGHLIDAVMEGRGAALSSELARLAQHGLEGIPILRAMAKRAQLLLALRIDIDKGASPQAAVDARGKAIFWKERNAIIRQVSHWDTARLTTVIERTLETERALKSSGSLGPILAEDALLTFTRVASRLR